MAGKRILTGVKPTGAPHLGNYVGAIKPALELAQSTDHSYLFIADYHALNALKDPDALRAQTYDVAATWLALGLDPARTVIYRQSDIPEIFELTTMISTVTPKGLMNRSHAYKALVDRNREHGKQDEHLDDGVNMGLFTYPILMAADILIADTEIVPVGKDQIQHLEMTRDIAGVFNRTFGEVFVLPEYKVQEAGAAIPGLDGRKMSKSYDNDIPVFAPSKRRRKMIMKIITDSKQPEEPKDPDESTIFQLMLHFGTDDEIAQMRDGFTQGGMGYGDAKKMLAEAVERELDEPSERYAELINDTAQIDDILTEGAQKMRVVAKETLARARASIGLHSDHAGVAQQSDAA